MLISNLLAKYKFAIQSLPPDKELTKEDLLIDAFLLRRQRRTAMYYAPHNEYINPDAKVVIVGITPGWTQMKRAYEAARVGIGQGLPDETICMLAKQQARFAGSMRRNLIHMLDELGLPEALSIGSSIELFEERQDLLHTTSLLRYPVFVQGKNYSGYSPSLLEDSELRGAALRDMEEELSYADGLIIPLGKTVEAVLELVIKRGQWERERVLWGFPHPSGANGHRQQQFLDRYGSMKSVISSML